MNPLKDYFYNNNKKLMYKWDHYFDIYHKYFEKYRGKPVTILEVGVSHGGSLQMWKSYFGDQAKIYGMDINPECKKLEEENIEIFIGSQEDRTFLKGLKDKMPKIDILLDDGSHFMKHQIYTFEELYDHINEDGIYLCEDTHTSYWKDFEGGYQRKSSYLEYTKRLVDQLNAWHSETKSLQPNAFTESSNAIHFYDSIVVIEKGSRQKPEHIWSGEAQIKTYQVAPSFDKTVKRGYRAVMRKLGLRKNVANRWKSNEIPRIKNEPNSSDSVNK